MPGTPLQQKITKIVTSRYPKAKKIKDAFIIDECGQTFVLKFVTKRLMDSNIRSTYGSCRPRGLYGSYITKNADVKTNASQLPQETQLVLQEGLMLSLGRLLVPGIFPYASFQILDQHIFLKENFIPGANLDEFDAGIYSENHPETVSHTFAQLTAVTQLFKNRDTYGDNARISSDGTIHGIDLVECGRGNTSEPKLGAWVWIEASNPLLQVIQEDIYAKSLCSTVLSIAEKIRSHKDVQLIERFLKENAEHLKKINYSDQIKQDIAWYYTSRKEFLEFANRIKTIIDLPYCQYELLYPKMFHSLHYILNHPEHHQQAYFEEAAYQKMKASCEGEIVYHMSGLNPFHINKIKYIYDMTGKDVSVVIFDEHHRKMKLDVSRLNGEAKENLFQLKNGLTTPRIAKEMVDPKQKRQNYYDPHLLSISFWDGPWDKYERRFYDGFHKLILNHVKYLVMRMKAAGKMHIRILDEPCGKGTLGASILQILRDAKMSVTYVGIDTSPVSLAQTRARLAPFKDVETRASRNVADKDFDFIISSGGLLQQDVAQNYDMAIDTLKWYAQMGLKPGGYLLAGGWTASFITANQISKKGLSVSIIDSTTRDTDSVLYIAQKPYPDMKAKPSPQESKLSSAFASLFKPSAHSPVKKEVDDIHSNSMQITSWRK